MEKQVARFGPFQSLIADAVKVGNTIHLSGTVSIDAKGQVVGAGDFFSQVRQAYSNVQAALEHFGANMNHIVDETWMVTDMTMVTGDLESFGKVREEAYGGTPQVTQTLVQVAGLLMPELLIEIKCTAYMS